MEYHWDSFLLSFRKHMEDEINHRGQIRTIKRLMGMNK
jgi:hypothetical protein